MSVATSQPLKEYCEIAFNGQDMTFSVWQNATMSPILTVITDALDKERVDTALLKSMSAVRASSAFSVTLH